MPRGTKRKVAQEPLPEVEPVLQPQAPQPAPAPQPIPLAQAPQPELAPQPVQKLPALQPLPQLAEPQMQGPQLPAPPAPQPPEPPVPQQQGPQLLGQQDPQPDPVQGVPVLDNDGVIPSPGRLKMETRRALSRKLYDVMENVGASEEMRQLHQYTATISEIMYTVGSASHTGRFTYVYGCGSSYEGSVTPDLASDEDVVHCHSTSPVVTDAQAAPPGLSYLIVRDNLTYPGYCKLQAMYNGIPFPAEYASRIDGTVDTTGRVCWKHIQLPNMQGPARMGFDDNGVHTVDSVRAGQCTVIPPFILECLSRPRPYGRSTELQAMAGLGCLFVGVGHVNSYEKDIEWKISFSLQEKRLMASLNPVQHKVYILLKMIKKNLLVEILQGESLTSYHCKTCILYLVQMTPENNWTPDNLIKCLLMCLQLLTKWIENNNCPSYFVRDHNLFLKEHFPQIRLPLLHLMRRILERGSDILYFIQSDNIGEILRNGDWRRYRGVTMEKKNAYVSKLKVKCAYTACDCIAPLIQGMGKDRYDPVTLATTLGALQGLETVNHHTTEVTQSALAYLYPWFHLHIAKCLISLTYRHPDTVDRQQLIEMADFHFNRARGVNLVNERLARASVLYISKQYDECFLLLKQVERDFTKHMKLLCPCSSLKSCSYYDMQDQHRQNGKIADLSVENFIKTNTATCVTFLPSELELAPAPLQYEMQRSVGTLPDSRSKEDFWFDWALVDARVYLYFMQYLVSSKLYKDAHKQVAMDNLRAEIADDDRRVLAGRKSRLGHKDTAYNLLGWIYMQEGQLTDAARCFTQSWRLRPYHNAAKFHMRDLMTRLPGRQQES